MNLDCTIRRTRSCNQKTPSPAVRFYRTRKSISGVCEACLKFAMRNNSDIWKKVPFMSDEDVTLEIVHGS